MIKYKRSGKVIEGMLDVDTHTSFPPHLTLSLCCQLEPTQLMFGLTEKFRVDLGEMEWLQVKQADLSRPSLKNRNTGSFSTDTDISSTLGKGHHSKRELQRWVPESEDPGEVLSKPSTTGQKWDQFAENERLFGVKTEFDESAYTTTVNRNVPGWQEREKRAERLAKEIQSQPSINPHLIEERTGKLLDDEEEALYGAVWRQSGDQKPPGFTQPLTDDIVSLPVRFSADQSMIVDREFRLAQAAVEREAPIAVPESIKSRLNPAAAEFIPSVDYSQMCYQSETAAYGGSEYEQTQSGVYYYYDAYGNCYFYNQNSYY